MKVLYIFRNGWANWIFVPRNFGNFSNSKVSEISFRSHIYTEKTIKTEGISRVNIIIILWQLALPQNSITEDQVLAQQKSRQGKIDCTDTQPVSQWTDINIGDRWWSWTSPRHCNASQTSVRTSQAGPCLIQWQKSPLLPLCISGDGRTGHSDEMIQLICLFSLCRLCIILS